MVIVPDTPTGLGTSISMEMLRRVRRQRSILHVEEDEGRGLCHLSIHEVLCRVLWSWIPPQETTGGFLY